MKVYIHGMKKNNIGTEQGQQYLIELSIEKITPSTEEIKRKFTNELVTYLKKNKATNVQVVQNRNSKKSNIVIYFDKEIKQFTRVERTFINKVNMLIEELENDVLEMNREEEKKIKSRAINNDILRTLIDKTNSNWSISECYYEESGVNETYVLATKNCTLDIAFKLNDNLEISNVKGGSMISYGEWLDLEPNDTEIIEGIEELKILFDEVKEKYQEIIKKSNGIYKIYSNEVNYICENKVQGKYYIHDYYEGYIIIDINNGEIKKQSFNNLIDCIEYLILENEKIECFKCLEDVKPTISIYVEFKNGEDYSELTDLENEEEVAEYIKDIIKEKQWEDEVKEYSYGLYCPYCLNSLN